MKSLTLASIIVPFVHPVELCGAPLDVMFLQDTTGSFDDDLPIIMEQLPQIIDAISSTYNGSRIGVAEFRDKPFYPLGEADDFCYKLNDGRLSSDLSDFYWAYDGLYASGGADTPEATFQALINVALDPAVGWSDRQRVVILNTDAVTHLPGDMGQYAPEVYPEVPQGLPANSGGVPDGDVTYSCLFEDYPGPEQVRDVLQSQKIVLIIFTPDDYQNVTSSWTWVNEQLLGQSPANYQFIQADSSDLAEKLISLLYGVAPPCPTTEGPSTTSVVSTSSEASSTEMVSEVTDSETTSLTGTESTSLADSEETCVCQAPCLPPCSDPCCQQNEVMVFLKHKPSHLHMEIHN